ncbi:unnamed protein product, partial [Brenthis ino]
MFIKISGLQRQVLASLCCYIGQLVVGFTLAWTGPIIPKLQDPTETPLSVQLSDTQLSLVASVIYVGGIPGPYITGWLSNVKGRKPCMIIAGVVLTTSYLILAISNNLAMIYCGRLLTGFGMGCVGVMNLVYIGEIASTNIRGILLTIIGIFHTAGSIVVYASGLFLSYVGVTSVGFVLSFIFTIFALFLPESPMFYILKGEDGSVRKVLEDLGRSNDIDEMIVSKKEYISSTAKKDWKELFTDANNRKALTILIVGNIFMQCSGIIAIVVFSGTIFSMAGSTLNSNVAMIIICSCELTGSMLVPFMIEKCGRKILMKISCILCSLSMLIMGLYFFFDFKQYYVVNNIRWLPTVILIVFFFVYDLGLGVIPGTLIGEMFKTNVRSKGSAVTITSSWIFGFLVTTAFGSLIDIVGAHVLFWFFSLYLGQAVLGYSLSWSGPIIPKLQNLEESPLPYLLTETQISLVGSLVYLGSIPGPFLIGWLANYKGRKPCLILGGIGAITAYVILSTTRSLALLYFGKILNSFAGGMISVNNVVYIGEMASTNIRGILLSALGMFTTFGSIILFSVGPFFSYQTSTYVGLGMSVLFTVTVLIVPESPMFFVLKDKEEELIKVLGKLGRIEDKEKLYETKQQYKSTTGKMDWIELLTLRTNRNALFIAIIANIFQQISGVMAVVFFSASIFEMSESSISSSTSMLIISCLQFFGGFLSPMLIERSGRKILMLLSTAICSLSMLTMGTYLYLYYLNPTITKSVKWLPLVALSLFFIGYDIGLGIIPNCLIGEMFTINVRSKASAVVLTFSWMSGFLLTTAFGFVVKNLGSYVPFLFFAFTCGAAFLFTIFYIPETRCKSLLEIQKLLAE